MVLTFPSKLGAGSGHRDVGLCCLEQVRFPAGVDMLRVALLALVPSVPGPSGGGDPT